MRSDASQNGCEGPPTGDHSSFFVATHNLHEARAALLEECRLSVLRHSLPPLTEPMAYAMERGKCLRGLLLIAVAESCGSLRRQPLEAAVAIEMLHAASLVVDDLPALDNTELRRGAPSLYKRFGEATAILTSHALVAAAFEVVARLSSPPERVIQITRHLASAIGACGMARGELAERANRITPNLDVRALKTGSLFQVAAHVGSTLAGAKTELAPCLSQLGLQLGICYQFADDARDDPLSAAGQRELRESSRRNWRQCTEMFRSIRDKLHQPQPLENWLSWFREAGACETSEVAPAPVAARGIG